MGYTKTTPFDKPNFGVFRHPLSHHSGVFSEPRHSAEIKGKSNFRDAACFIWNLLPLVEYAKWTLEISCTKNVSCSI
jgi:hypothetical protein